MNKYDKPYYRVLLGNRTFELIVISQDDIEDAIQEAYKKNRKKQNYIKEISEEKYYSDEFKQ